MIQAGALRCASVAAALVSATLLTLGAATPAIGDVVPQRFHADSGNDCPLGVSRGETNGTIGWGDRGEVHIRGTVVDRPLPNDPSRSCGEDGRFSVATLTGFAAGRQVVRTAERADNGGTEFSRIVRASVPIDTVVIQVCRHSSGNPGPFDYCGLRVQIDRRINATG